MTDRRLRIAVPLIIAALFSIALIVSMRFGVEEIPAAKETSGIIGTDGNPVAAVCISDLAELNALLNLNYTAGAYVKPQVEVRGDIARSDDHKAAQSGTYQLVIMNLDPFDENFNSKSEALKPFLQGDNQWHFTLYIPNVWSACNVYVRTVLTERAGDLADYNFIEHTEYTGSTQYHKSQTEPLFIDLSFYSDRMGIYPGNRLKAAVVVTIHYESQSGRMAGMDGVPLIGSDNAVRRAVNRDSSVLTASLIITALILVVFVFLCLLKRSLSFVPQLLIPLGVFFALLSGFMLSGAAATPFLWLAAGRFAMAFIPLAAATAVSLKIKKIPLGIIIGAPSLVLCVLALISPFSSFGVSAAFRLGFGIANAAAALTVSLAAVCSAIKHKNTALMINPLIAGIALTAASFLPATMLAVSNPLLWLFDAILVVAAGVGLREFAGAERENRYLNANLQSEVARQTVNLKNIIDDRDKILLFVSHDMKKPVVALGSTLTGIGESADGELKAKVDAAVKKYKEIRDNFDELSKFSKVNFVAEESKALPIEEVIFEVYDYLKPDCEANGVVLNVAPTALKAYAKRKALSGVIYNLVMNALEHAECSAITLSAKKIKNMCQIDVADNGKGIAQDKDIFEPFISDNADESNVGLGLYLSKTAVDSMGGSLTYSQSENGLVFSVTLPLA